ncbi:MAG: thiamine phosphate synthase [Magnetospirillum sp.]|nr:thiamine phosphate synthase [Magnetospirillum sp.]
MTLTNVARRLKRAAPRRVPSLLLVTDPRRLPDPLAAARRLPRGAAVLLRHYGGAAGDPERTRRAEMLAALCRCRRLTLLVAVATVEDWRLAQRIGAAGLHLPEGLARHGVVAPLLAWRRRKGMLLSVACHSPAALHRAAALGADWGVLSPVFATASHPRARTIGSLRFATWVRRARLPVVALGGVADATAGRLLHSTAAGLAAIGALAE